MIHRCIAKKVYTLTHDAKSQQEFADAVSEFAESKGGYLDSIDAGDAMGFIMQYLDFAKSDAEILVIPNNIVITISYDWDLFEWTES